jgi:hypothetical protein
MHKKISAIAIEGFALLVVLGAVYRAMAQDAVTPYPKDGPDRPIPHGGSGCGNSPGAKCCTGVHLTRCRGTGSGTAWFRNGGQRQKRLRVYRGTGVDFRA